jgi:hypothetical protein
VVGDGGFADKIDGGDVFSFRIIKDCEDELKSVRPGIFLRKRRRGKRQCLGRFNMGSCEQWSNPL